jgi:hypothetical protein
VSVRPNNRKTSLLAEILEDLIEQIDFLLHPELPKCWKQRITAKVWDFEELERKARRAAHKPETKA